MEIKASEIEMLYTFQSRSKFFLSWDDANLMLDQASEDDQYFGVQSEDLFGDKDIPASGRMWVSGDTAHGQRSHFENEQFDNAQLISVVIV